MNEQDSEKGQETQQNTKKIAQKLQNSKPSINDDLKEKRATKELDENYQDHDANNKNDHASFKNQNDISKDQQSKQHKENSNAGANQKDSYEILYEYEDINEIDTEEF